ncbi:Porin [Acetobacteraceae bacterium EV16G]|uniref:Porin n=1 Tax=Sorlinia euscelidii TaxID=3081148 RepID=A0ABU7U4Q8_9PROT
MKIETAQRPEAASARVAMLASLLIACVPVSARAQLTNLNGVSNATIESRKMSPGPECQRYDPMITQGSESPIITTCDTLVPGQFGLRKFLGDRGFLFEGFYTASMIYDVLGHQQRPQLYNGQRPNFSGNLWLNMTYDLERVGFNPGSQLTVSMNNWQSAYTGAGIRATSLSQATVLQKFFNGHVSILYGYYGILGQFYGMFMGTSTASSALGPLSIIPNQVGLSMYTPTPGADVRIYLPDRRFYNHIGVARSQSALGFLADSRANPSGVNLQVNGTRAVVIDEIGFRVHPESHVKMTWFRAGGIYNATPYRDFRTNQFSASNNAWYVVLDRQLLQPDPKNPYRGWYIELKTDHADRRRNIFTDDYAATIYTIGPLKSRPRDMLSIGFTYNKIGPAAMRSLQAGNARMFDHSTTTSVAYAAHAMRGVYFTTTASYTTKPFVAEAKPDALSLQGNLTLSF